VLPVPGRRLDPNDHVAGVPTTAIPALPPTSRSARRVDTRIRPGRMTWMTSSTPQSMRLPAPPASGMRSPLSAGSNPAGRRRSPRQGPPKANKIDLGANGCTVTTQSRTRWHRNATGRCLRIGSILDLFAALQLGSLSTNRGGLGVESLAFAEGRVDLVVQLVQLAG
jgi:hypothetical protein